MERRYIKLYKFSSFLFFGRTAIAVYSYATFSIHPYFLVFKKIEIRCVSEINCFERRQVNDAYDVVGFGATYCSAMRPLLPPGASRAYCERTVTRHKYLCI